jgi:hypothetical protein
MNNNQKVMAVSAGLIILGLYFFYKQKKQYAEVAKEETKEEEEEEPIMNENGIDFSAKTDFDKVLKKGDYDSKEVYILQKALKQIAIDGDFGDKTEKRLKAVMKVTQTSLNQYNKFINKK